MANVLFRYYSRYDLIYQQWSDPEQMQSNGVGEIRRSLLVGIFLRLLGQKNRAIRLTVSGLIILARSKIDVSFSAISSPVQVIKRFGFTAIQLTLADGRQIKVSGVNQVEARSFATKVNNTWRQYFASQFNIVEDELTILAKVVKRLNQPKRYPSACLLEPFLIRATRIINQFPANIPEEVLSTQREQLLNTARGFNTEPNRIRNTAIKAFIKSELQEMEEFFNTIESNPLTPEQRLAVITDEDATLVLAGAGSGKTSVIVAKAAYLIQRNIRKQNEILLMAFGKDAAAEMTTRIEERTGAKVDAMTFHALGYGIIREVENGAPALAPHASDDAQFRVLLRDILINDLAGKKGLLPILLKWFSGFFWPYKSEWDFKTKSEYYQYVEAHELRTFQGEVVKSFEELEIANWLYLNSIAYEYEPDYEHDLPENERGAYTPDFRLTDSGVYIEHFGVRKKGNPDGSFRLTTAPYVDRQNYLEGMDWKRKIHDKYDTVLIETFSYERVEGRLTKALEEKLAQYAKPEPIAADKVFSILSEMGQLDSFTQTLGTFLRHFKSSGIAMQQCKDRAEQSEDTQRSIAFLKIFEPLLEAYQRRLGKRIDFEDMIVRATEHVLAGRYQSPYRHLLIDEFQDISDGRSKLLLALKKQHSDARIFAVGDDWQSIYRFAGADIHLMRNFGEIFGGKFADADDVHCTVDLGRTFRSVDKIALPARSFVLKNPSQIKKQVIPSGTSDTSAIKVVYYTGSKDERALRMALETIQSSATGNKTSVLLLGRYKFVKPDNLSQLSNKYPKLSITFKTVHASKGLEADHIFILRAASNKMGFPSEIVDDPLLNLVLPKPEKFNHAEERRLFYVAMTRARKSVTVLANREKPSVFAQELLGNSEYNVVRLGEPGIAEHRCGACGGRMLVQTNKKGRVYFACEHRQLCGETLKPCTVCKTDLPIVNQENTEEMICSCGAHFPVCPKCSDGWLVERKGQYGKFLSCVKYPKCSGKKQLPK